MCAYIIPITILYPTCASFFNQGQKNTIALQS